MIDARNATLEDLREASTYAKENFTWEELQSSGGALEHGPAVTLFDTGSGRIGAVIGMSLYWDGVATFWSVTTEHLADHPLAYTRRLLALLEQTVERLGLHRVEMDVRADYLAGQRWAEALGFEKEFLMKQYGSDKSDFFKYRRLF